MNRLTVNLSVTSAGSAELAIGYGTDASEADRDDLFTRSRALMDSVCRRVDAPDESDAIRLARVVAGQTRDRKRLDSIGETLERYDEGGDGDYDQRVDALGQRALKGEADAKWGSADRDLATALIDAIEQRVKVAKPTCTSRAVGKLIADYRAPKVTTRDADVPF